MLLATLLWSMAGVVTRHLQMVGSFEATFWRSFFNAAALVMLLAWLRGWRPLASTLRSGGPLHKVKRAPEQNGALARPPVELPRRILVGVDLSSASLPALQHAGWLATHLGAEVTVQHVVDITYSTLPYLMGAGTGVDLHEQLIVRAGDALSRARSRRESRLREHGLHRRDLLAAENHHAVKTAPKYSLREPLRA